MEHRQNPGGGRLRHNGEKNPYARFRLLTTGVDLRSSQPAVASGLRTSRLQSALPIPIMDLWAVRCNRRGVSDM